MPCVGLTMVEGTITEWKAAAIAYEIVHGGFLHIVARARP